METKKLNLAPFLDLANHKPTAAKKDIEVLCQNVLKYGFNAAFVNPCWVRFAKSTLRHLRGEEFKHLGGGINWKPKVGTVISFPLGQDTTEMKIYAVRRAIEKGADELDISTNVAWLKTNPKIYLKELKRIVRAAKELRPETIVKFIIETGYLKDEEIQKASVLVLKSRADFVKTCSGLGPRGSLIKDVELIKKAVADKIKIKVAGGIATKKRALRFIKAGAVRIGTSKAVEIINEK